MPLTAQMRILLKIRYCKCIRHRVCAISVARFFFFFCSIPRMEISLPVVFFSTELSIEALACHRKVRHNHVDMEVQKAGRQHSPLRPPVQGGIFYDLAVVCKQSVRQMFHIVGCIFCIYSLWGLKNMQQCLHYESKYHT